MFVPHLAPLLWIFMPLLLSFMIYSQMILLYFTQPSCFPYIKLTNFKFSNWKW
uniref:ATP synthase F0 subunit 8 n=1 Tax=Typosyllis sp. patternB TaxID=1898411 RepID=A0A1C9UZC7_9ANNE|nr:ATP synthase F0 subunit 8 [Typosyllis sp. patternB]